LAPVSPLSTITLTYRTIGVLPFIPDSNAIVLEIPNVGIARDNPKELMNNRFEMELLCG
jgi:hypothetical protein